MLKGNVRPTTLDGVKSLATQLGKEQDLKHSVALDLAAKAANCANFRHALRTLPKRGTTASSPYVLLTMYWYDKKHQGHRNGRETLKIELSRPILDICGKSALKKVRGFGDLRMVADDHFVCDILADTQTYARERLCTAERSLRFMERTGLRPCVERRSAHRKLLAADNLPGNDHATDWTDPEGGQFILIDEPYAGSPNNFKRTAWASRTGWRIIKTTWPGMYNPYLCDLYVVTDGSSNYDLDALAAKIHSMPPPLLATDWPGESSPSWKLFTSPMAKTPQDARRARCRGTVYSVSSAATVPYYSGLGSSPRRPAGKMEIEGHVEAGRIIRAVLRSDQKTCAVVRRMSSLRSTLESWMSLEIGSGQREGPEFFEVYYREADEDAPYREMAKSRGGLVAMLGDLKQKLRSAYPDCAPLRKQLHRIDVSISLISKMKPTDGSEYGDGVDGPCDGIDVPG